MVGSRDRGGAEAEAEAGAHNGGVWPGAKLSPNRRAAYTQKLHRTHPVQAYGLNATAIPWNGEKNNSMTPSCQLPAHEKNAAEEDSSPRFF